MTSVSPATGPERNLAVDLFRCLAIFGVITIHISPGTQAAENLSFFFWVWAVPFFYLISLKFFIGKLDRENTWETLKKQTIRLVVPFLAWTLLYVALFEFKSRLTHQPRAFDWLGILVYGQSAVHLYFLPVMLTQQLAALFIYNLLFRNWFQKIWSVAGLVVVAAVMWKGMEMKYFGWGGFSGLALFVALGWFLAKSSWPRQYPRLFLALGAILFVVAEVAAFLGDKLLAGGIPLVLFMGGLGVCLISTGWRWPSRGTFLPMLLSTSYGIYLSHFLFIEGIEFFLPKLGWPLGIYSWSGKLLLAIVVFALGLAMTLLLKKVVILKTLFLGETSTATRNPFPKAHA